MTIKIKKGDKIMVIAGKDKGKTGMVERVFSKTGKMIIKGINIAKKHVKVSKNNHAGGIVEINMPMSVGKTALVCPSCGKPTRVGWQINGKEKNRVCKKCGKAILKIKKEDK